MKKRLVYFLMFSAILAVNIFLYSKAENYSLFHVVHADWEYPEDPEVGQITYQGYCSTRVCTEWSDPFVYEGERYCMHWAITNNLGTWCADNYVCPSCTCDGGDGC